jgi:hypothetical protein
LTFIRVTQPPAECPAWSAFFDTELPPVRGTFMVMLALNLKEYLRTGGA